MEAVQWVAREGEDVFYIGLIGAGGYGEIHRGNDCRFSSANRVFRSMTVNGLRFEVVYFPLLTMCSVSREN